MQQHDALAVGNGDVSEDHTHTPAAVFPAKSFAEGRRGYWAHKHIFKHGFHHNFFPSASLVCYH
jgi:hypothetical protein